MERPLKRDGSEVGQVSSASEATVVMEEPPPPFPYPPVGTGSHVGEWELLAAIGTGGCGTVFEACHRMHGRRAAIKLLHPDVAQSNEMVERFAREAHAANLIRHPNIIDVWELGRLPSGQPYTVMELLDGTNLTALLAHGRLTPAEALEILDPVCAAVIAAHQVGIVHRDLKASNIQIGGSPGARRITLLDFGIAKLTELDGRSLALTAIGRKLGTPSSMSPEQIRGGRVDARTDVYALGVLLFHMLTCRHPFESADPHEVERMHLERPPPLPSDLVPAAADLDAIVLRCLAKRPADRFASVPEFVDALRAAVARAPARPPRTAPAAALLVEISLSEEALEAADDAMLIDLSNAMECAESMLVDAGLHLALQTGSSALGVALLPADAADRNRERARIAERAVALYQELDRREGKQAGVTVTVCLHVDQALVGDGSAPELGGPILGIGGWMPHTRSGLYMTPAAADGMATISVAKFKVIRNTQIS